jgi:hypothetical protein
MEVFVMADLAQQVNTYLEAEGYTVSSRRELFVGSRRTIAEETEYTYVWVPSDYDPARFSSREASFLTRFSEAVRSNPTASQFMLVPTLEGLSRQFRDGVLQWYRVNVRTPVQFFDTDFKWDSSSEASSEAKKLRDKGRQESARRVPQPYIREDVQESGKDLLGVLRSQITTLGVSDKKLNIVIGPAGIGKSYLFDILFAELHEAFMAYKTRGGPYSPRPLPLLPEYLPIADARTVRSLLSAYLQTDFARPLKRQTFEWLLANEFAVWMLDGLDEVISQDPSFFDYLLDLLTLPNAAAKPKMIICVRDALLSSHGAFKEFLDDYSDQIAVYRLAKWEMPSKRRFAELALAESAGKFIKILNERPSLNELASTPYYCDLLSQRFEDGRLGEEYSAASLLEEAITSLINRDYTKGFIDKSMVELKDVMSFLEAAASEDFGHSFEGISVQNAQEWARILLPQGLSEEEQMRLSSQMANLGLFSRGSPGYIRFSQEILEHYLIGRRLVSLFEDGTRPEAFVQEVAHRELPSDWLTVHLVAEHVKNTKQFDHLKSLVCDAVAYPTAFKNTLKIALLCPNQPTALRDIPYERHDLSGLVFDSLDLQGVSFAGCDLTDVEFRRCNLKRIVLTGAIIKNTGFFSLPPDGLRSAQIGDLARFFSMRVDRKIVIEDHKQAHQWFEQQTKEHILTVEPCVSALQLRYLFNKLVSADGTFRRTSLNHKGMLAGKRFHSSPDKVLEAAIRHGYFIQEERYRDRVHRPEGQLYGEMVSFATRLELTPGIKAVLDDVCEIEGCSHVPVVK